MVLKIATSLELTILGIADTVWVIQINGSLHWSDRMCRGCASPRQVYDLVRTLRESLESNISVTSLTLGARWCCFMRYNSLLLPFSMFHIDIGLKISKPICMKFQRLISESRLTDTATTTRDALLR